MKSFENKVALITGGTSGIGRSSAVEFGKLGAKVVVSGRREAEGNETVRLVKDAGGEALFVQSDVSKESDIAALIETTVSTFGKIDCAFNNAGIEGELLPAIEQTADNFDKVFNINVKGVLLSMKYQIDHMLKAGGGSIVNNASIASIIGMPGGTVYFGSKHAVVGMTKCAALEVAQQGIRINAVSPGAIQTEMWDRFTGDDQQMQEQMASLHPIGRIGNSDEIAKAVLFLCSDDASFITGQNLAVDGGFTTQ